MGAWACGWGGGGMQARAFKRAPEQRQGVPVCGATQGSLYPSCPCHTRELLHPSCLCHTKDTSCLCHKGVCSPPVRCLTGGAGQQGILEAAQAAKNALAFFEGPNQDEEDKVWCLRHRGPSRLDSRVAPPTLPSTVRSAVHATPSLSTTLLTTLPSTNARLVCRSGSGGGRGWS